MAVRFHSQMAYQIFLIRKVIEPTTHSLQTQQVGRLQACKQIHEEVIVQHSNIAQTQLSLLLDCAFCFGIHDDVDECLSNNKALLQNVFVVGETLLSFRSFCSHEMEEVPLFSFGLLADVQYAGTPPRTHAYIVLLTGTAYLACASVSAHTHACVYTRPHQMSCLS